MNKILTTLIVIALLFFAVTFFYVFELPPFNPGGAIIPARPIANGPQSTQELPDFLTQEKVERGKTYEEHMNRGALLLQNGYSALAIAEYEAASKQNPGSADPLIEIGKVHFADRDLVKAKLAFDQALTVSAGNVNATVMLARTYIADRKVSEAQRVLNSLPIHNQSSKYYLGLITAVSGDHEKAKSLLRESIAIGGNAEMTERAKIVLNAYDEFDFNQGGKNTHLKTLLGRGLDQVTEYDLAISLLIDVIKEKKDYRDAWILLGYAYLKTEKYQDAKESLETARKLDPQKPETSFFLGLSYMGLNDLNSAAQYLEIAKSNGFQPQVQVDQKLAEVYLQMQEYEKASVSYEAVLSLNSQDVNYFIKPIWIYLEKLNNPEKAVALANKALSAHPDEAMSYNLLGWATTGTGRFSEAKKYLDQARSMDPDLDAVYLNYGTLFEKEGDFETAKVYYKKAYEMGSGNSISNAAADRYDQLIAGKSPTPMINAASFMQPTTSLKADLLTQ